MDPSKLKRLVSVLYIFGILPGFSGSAVTLSINSGLADDGSLLCDAKAEIKCETRPYRYVMSWEIDNKVAAECTFHNCTTYTTGVANYGFSFDTSKGIFSITVDPVTFAENGKIFKCDDGYTSARITAVVHVIPDNSLTTISFTRESAFTKIKATSGCLHPSSRITFEWYYFKDGNPPTLYDETEGILSTDGHGCSSGPCGGHGVVKVTNTLTLQEYTEGEEYYFQVLVKHPDRTGIIVKAEKPFKIKGVDNISAAPVKDTNLAERVKLNSRVQLLSMFVTSYLFSRCSA